MSRHPRKRRPQLPGAPVTLSDGHAYTIPVVWNDPPPGYPPPLAAEQDAILRDLLTSARVLSALEGSGLASESAAAKLQVTPIRILGLNYMLDPPAVADILTPEAVVEILDVFLDAPRFRTVTATLSRVGLTFRDFAPFL